MFPEQQLADDWLRRAPPQDGDFIAFQRDLRPSLFTPGISASSAYPSFVSKMFTTGVTNWRTSLNNPRRGV
jgi:hypothetical protein